MRAQIVPIGLALLSLVALLIAGLMAWGERAFLHESLMAPGVVRQLNDGPLHADVTVTPATGPSFVHAENGSRRPLAVGQRVEVRYRAALPGPTARIASLGGYDLAWGFAGVGVLLLLAALLPPLPMARLRGLSGFAVR